MNEDTHSEVIWFGPFMEGILTWKEGEKPEAWLRLAEWAGRAFRWPFSTLAVNKCLKEAQREKARENL